MSTEQKNSTVYNPSPFIQKLFRILNDETNSEIICFNEAQRQIQISSKKKLEKILANHFRHAKYESFIRQLNWYGFYKVNNHALHCYRHQNIEKGMSILSIKSRRNTQGKNKELLVQNQVLQVRQTIVEGESRHPENRSILSSNYRQPQTNIQYQNQIQLNPYYQQKIGYPQNLPNIPNIGYIPYQWYSQPQNNFYPVFYPPAI